jgi:hypothetical protein
MRRCFFVLFSSGFGRLHSSFQLMLASRPFVAIASLLMAGIVAEHWLRLSAVELLSGAVVTLGLIVWKKTRWAGTGAVIFLLGAFLLAERFRISSSSDLRLMFSGEPELVTLRGMLA